MTEAQFGLFRQSGWVLRSEWDAGFDERVEAARQKVTDEHTQRAAAKADQDTDAARTATDTVAVAE